MKKINVWIAIILGIAFFAASVAVSVAYYTIKSPAKTISVVGLAEQEFTSDLIVWGLDFSVKKMDIKEAYQEIKKQTDSVKEYLVSKGVKSDEIVFDALSNYKDTRYEWHGERYNSVFDGYVLTQSVSVTSKRVDEIEKIARESTELIDLGIHINSNSPQYYYTQLADLKIEMLAAASQDARNRAEVIASNAGAKLSKLKTANMGVFQITAPNSSDEDYTWGGAFNIYSKTKKANINMRLTYFLK